MKLTTRCSFTSLLLLFLLCLYTLPILQSSAIGHQQVGDDNNNNNNNNDDKEEHRRLSSSDVSSLLKEREMSMKSKRKIKKMNTENTNEEEEKNDNNDKNDDHISYIVHLHPTTTHEEFEVQLHDMYRRKAIAQEKMMFGKTATTNIKKYNNTIAINNKLMTTTLPPFTIKQRFTRLLHAVVIQTNGDVCCTKRELKSIKSVRKVVRNTKKKILRTNIGNKYTMIHKQQDAANTYNIDITSSNVKKKKVASVQDGGFTSPTWGQDRIDQISLPLNGIYNPLYDGSGTDIYIIDTGIDTTHIEFQNDDSRLPHREVKNIWDAYAKTEHDQNNPGISSVIF